MAFPTNGRWDAILILKNKAGQRLDIAGKNFAMGLMSDLRNDAPEVTLSTTDGTLIADVNGRLRMNVPYTITKTLTQGQYHFDIVELLDDGDQAFVAEGKLTLRRGITRT